MNQTELLSEQYKNCCAENDALKNELDAALMVIANLKAENARLREALERIDSECSRDDTIAWKIANDTLERFE